MVYEEMTYERIMSRCLARVPGTVDKREGSIIYDAKSILGVICLGLGNVLKVKYNDRNEDFEALLNRYRVADAGAVL